SSTLAQTVDVSCGKVVREREIQRHAAGNLLLKKKACHTDVWQKRFSKGEDTAVQYPLWSSGII
ncbi:hypothetical protein, partial [Escherichia coli]|uniref:hypothetical protein n=1 Tax=Escherichia coli TaxID=562 RepID=UPI002157F5DF